MERTPEQVQTKGKIGMNGFTLRGMVSLSARSASAVCLGVFTAALSLAPMSAQANANWIGGSGGSEAEPYEGE